MHMLDAAFMPILHGTVFHPYIKCYVHTYMRCYLLIIVDTVFMHALRGILMHALDGASMHLFNVIITHTVIATSMDILHAALSQIPRNHIATPQDPLC